MSSFWLMASFWLTGLTVLLLFFVKQKTSYEMRISDWSSDVCSSDLTKADTVAWYGADDLTRIALIDCIVVSDDLIDALHIAEHVEASMNLGRITGMDGLYFGVSRADRKSTRLNSSH